MFKRGRIYLRDLIIEIEDGINSLKKEFNDDLYNNVHQLLLKLEDLIDENRIPKEIYLDIIKYHHKRRLIHASLKTNNKGSRF